MVVMVGAFLLAQLDLPPKFQPGPARVPEQTPITRPQQLEPDEGLLEDSLEESKTPSATSEQNENQQILSRYQRQGVEIKGNSVYNDDKIREFLIHCRQTPTNLSAGDWAALCITLRYQQDGFINTRVYTTGREDNVQLEVIEGRLTELRINGPNARLNRKTEHKLSALKNKILNANEVLWALQLVQQQPGSKRIQGRLGRVGSDASQSSLIVKAEPKQHSMQGLMSYDNSGKISVGQNRNQAILAGESLLQLADRWVLYTDKTWTGSPKAGSSTYSLSYIMPMGHRTNGTVSLGMSTIKPIEFGGLASQFRTNQFQFTGLLNRTLIDSYDRELTLFGQYSFTRSNLYLNGEELPSIIPNLIRKPQNGYIKLGLDANKINRRSILNGQLFISQAIPASIPADQTNALNSIGVSAKHSTAIGASVSTQMVLNGGLRFKAGLAGQKSLGRLVNSMRFQVGAVSGLMGLPSTVLSGEDGIQVAGEFLIPISKVNGWSLAFKPFVGIGAVTSRAEPSTTIGSYGTLLNLSNPSGQLSLDVGWTGHAHDSGLLDNLWDDWNLSQGLITRGTLSF